MSKPIKPYTTSLNDANAYWMAKIAKEVYQCVSNDDPTPNREVILANLQEQDAKFVEVYPCNNNSAQAALIEHQDYLCLAFRGTDEIRDWLDNLNAFATKQLFGEFHRGFWRSLEDVWQPMDKKLRELQQAQARPVFFTGHSLGGAMATMAAAKFIHEDKPFTSVYTFGQPRALTRETAQIFNIECKSRYFRFHNNNDVVTRVPARIMGYSHVGSYLYISEQEDIHQESGFWFRFVDQVVGVLDDIKEAGFDGIKDHDMDNYLRAIERWQFGD